MADFKTYNEQGVEIEVTKSDFELVQRDEKIHDVKFESKPTTFWKDAFKRFCKNKSSVVATYIIGIIIVLAIFVPIFSPHDVKNPDLSKTLLPPKLFEAGTGFWDGTKEYKNIVYDTINEVPADFKGDCVVEYLGQRSETINVANNYAHGGTFVFVNDNLYEKGQNPLDVEIDGKFKYVDFTEHYYKATFNASLDQKVTITLDNENNLLGYELGLYRVILKLEKEDIVLKDWSDDYSEFTLDISKALKDADITSSVEGKIRLELQPLASGNDKNHGTYIGIKSIIFSTDETKDTPKNIETLGNISFDNANYTVMTSRTETGYPVNYWQSNGKRLIANAQITYVDFVYDWYKAKLGFTQATLGGSDLDKYIANGWCEYDYKVGPSSFKVLDAKNCPVEEILDQKYDYKDGFYTLTIKAYKYKLAGYEKMPIYLFGTDNNGYDLFTLCFKGLRYSLFVAVCVSAVCIAFGICWGSISGYFGGNVDLIMERFCDILGGIPWTVLMTIAILLMGQNALTFGIAMCITGWMGTAARTRTQFYRFKNREYIFASRTLGAKDSRLIFRHILPNSIGTLVTSLVLMIPSTIFSETSLSYLGLLSVSDSFGVILSRNQTYLSSQPALILFPAVIISLIMISFNLFGNGLRDALNPSLKGSE